MKPTAEPTDPVWSPPVGGARSEIAAFQAHIADRYGIDPSGYTALWEWSTTDIARFWAEVWEWFDVGLPVPSESVLVDEGMPDKIHWFPGTEVNFASYVLGRCDSDDVAIIGATEQGPSTTLGRRELKKQVLAFAQALRELGVETGDRVVGYLPNIPEAVVAFLGSAAIGAVWSAVGQDYAPAAAAGRFTQLAPKILVAADGQHWNGTLVSRRDAVAELHAALPTVEHVVGVRYIDDEPLPGTLAWDELIQRDASGFAPLPVPFEHPLWVLYSSGTTGLPKGLVHSHGGVLLELLKVHGFHFDIGVGDRLFWYTSPSWVMWNIQVGALAAGASIVCYDGAPAKPTVARLWEIVAEETVTFFGTSPGFLATCERDGLRPKDGHDLSRLRAMGATGSPLPAHLQHWASDAVGPIPLWSVSGGTDIASGFAGGSPTVPIRPGEISVPLLGVALDSLDEKGRPVRDSVGELVVTRPMPSMPSVLWNDPTFTRYRESYFAPFPGIWRQGDWVTMMADRSIIIHGRSDSTLNRGGVRIGSADIYAVVENMPEIAEALVLGVELDTGAYWMPLFVVLADGVELDAALRTRIAEELRTHASPRHVPDEVIAVRAVPHTKTGKKLEVPVKRILQGSAVDQVVNPDVVDDPTLLALFLEIADSHTKEVAR